MALIPIQFYKILKEKWYNVTELAGVLSFKECDADIKWKIPI